MGQDFTIKSDIKTEGDSVILAAMNITNNPFQFGNNTLGYLSKLHPKIKWKPVANTHASDKIDTIFTLSFSRDEFQVYKVDRKKNFLMNADLSTPRFKTRHGIKVGMTKGEVVGVLQDYRLPTLPKYLVLMNAEVWEYFKIEFVNDKVANIIFCGYID